MKKFFIAAVMMVAAMNVNAKSDDYLFTHFFYEIEHKYHNVSKDLVWAELGQYVEVANEHADEVDRFWTWTHVLNEAYGSKDLTGTIQYLQAINDDLPDLFEDVTCDILNSIKD